jgi:5-methylthioribose kinase
VAFFFGYVSLLEISSILSNYHLNYIVFDMLEKKRSREEFEAYLKAMLKQDYPKVKYQSPDAWRRRAFKKRLTK